MSAIALAITIIASLTSTIVSGYKFKSNYSSDWELADKSSTLEAKSEYLDKFVENLEIGKLTGDFHTHGALIFKNDANSFSENLNALKTLQLRLRDVKDMNPNSFEYNTAIQQITGQEQGEASDMIGIFKEGYTIKNYPLGSSTVGSVLFLAGSTLCIILGMGCLMFWDELGD